MAAEENIRPWLTHLAGEFSSRNVEESLSMMVDDAAEAHRNLAELYEKLGHNREAMRHLSILHRLGRDSPP